MRPGTSFRLQTGIVWVAVKELKLNEVTRIWVCST